MDLHSLRKKLSNILLRLFLQLKILKSSIEKAIYFITNKYVRGFLVRYIFQKVLFSKKEIRASGIYRKTNLVINAYFIGFD